MDDNPFPKSDHFDGKLFFNPGAESNKGLLAVLKWQLEGNKAEWPKHVDDGVATRAGQPLLGKMIRITYINHATLLIEMPGFTVITDPIFSKRASPVSFAGPARVREPGVDIDALPNIDAVLVSHNHYDHLDLPSLRRLQKKYQPTFFAPLGNRALLKKSGAEKIIELDWWQTQQIGTAAVTAVPVRHWSRRSMIDTNHALWSGFVVKCQGLQVYFSGDTAYGPHFTDTAQRMGAMDFSILPIGAYEPRWFMKTVHMNPTESVQAHLDLQSRQSIAMHFGTFQLTDEGIEAPVQALEAALREHQVRSEKFRAPKHGESIEYSA